MSSAQLPNGFALVRLADRCIYWRSDGLDPSILDALLEGDHLLGDLRVSKASGHDESLSRSTQVTIPSRMGSADYLVTAHPISVDGIEVALIVIAASGDAAGTETRVLQDGLTGLADRGALEARLARFIQPQHHQEPVALLFLDLDGFKEVNDRHGHLVGDEVLATIGQRLGTLVGERNFVARFGGDEFVILIEKAHDRKQLESLVARLRSAIEIPIETSEGLAHVGASVGIAVSTEGFESPRAWLAAADRRMYDEKRREES